MSPSAWTTLGSTLSFQWMSNGDADVWNEKSADFGTGAVAHPREQHGHQKARHPAAHDPESSHARPKSRFDRESHCPLHSPMTGPLQR